MRIHVVKHVPFEGPALIARWALERGHSLTESLSLFEEHPPLGEFDLLVVMGGPMSADDHAAHPWLDAEKRFVEESVSAGRSVLGVCLGAQVIASALGAEVRRNAQKEIGWYPVQTTPEAADDPVLSALPERLVVGNWHGDTFGIPDGGTLAASSAACPNQAFSIDAGRVVGLQFHLEWDRTALDALLAECGDELSDCGRFVSTPAELVAGVGLHGATCAQVLEDVLDRIAQCASPEGA